MFRAKMNDARAIKGIFEAVGALIQEAELVVGPEGLSIQAIDSSHICFVCLTVKATDFNEFQCEGEHRLGIVIPDLVKILKCGDNEDEVTLSCEDESKLIVTMKHPGRQRGSRFSIGTIEVGGEEVSTERLDAVQYKNVVTVDIKYLVEAMKNAEIFSDVATMSMAGAREGMSITAIGVTGDMEYELGPEDLGKVQIKTRATGTYSIQYVSRILKVGTIAKQVQVSQESQTPLRFEFAILNETSGSRFVFYLAPRVQEDQPEEDAPADTA